MGWGGGAICIGNGLHSIKKIAYISVISIKKIASIARCE